MAANDVSRERAQHIAELMKIGGSMITNLDTIADGMKQGLWGDVVLAAENLEFDASKFLDLCKRMAKTEAQAKIQIPPR